MSGKTGKDRTIDEDVHYKLALLPWDNIVDSRHDHLIICNKTWSMHWWEVIWFLKTLKSIEYQSRL